MAEQNLKDKTVKGLGWSTVENFSRLGISFIVGIILARLLSPDEYGLIGILTIFITIFNCIVDSGFTAALIRKQNTTEQDYSTVFYVNLGISVVLAFVMYLSAGLIATFFERTELVALTQAMSIVVVINAFSIVQRVILTKKLDFKTQTKITLISSVISGIIGISMAYCGFGVWALVSQQISSQLLNTLLLWVYNRWMPSLCFNSASFKEMWSFGWKLLAVSIIDNTWKEIYQVVIGKCYTPATLGLYTRAKQFSDMCSSNLTGVIQRVTYPVLSSIQDDKTRLKQAYKRIIRCSMLITFVLMLGMASSAPSMILFIIGEKWVDCVPLLQLICISAMLYPLHALNLNMLQVQGRSDLFLKLEIIKKIIMVVPLLLGIFVGIYYMLAGSIVTGWIAYYLNARYSGPYLNYSIVEQIKDIIPSFGVAVGMAIPIYAMNYLPVNVFLLFPLQVCVGALFVLILCERTRLPEYLEIKNIVISKISKR